MKIKFRCGLLAILLLGSSVSASAGNGIKRNQWDFGPEISLNNIVYPTALGVIMPSIYGEERPWWGPNFISKSYIGLSPSLFTTSGTYDRSTKSRVGKISGNEKKAKWYDPDLKSFSIGYSVNYMSKEFPIGFFAKLAYEQNGFDAEISKDDVVLGDYKFRKQMIVPELVAKIRIGNYRTWEGLFTIDVGGSYDWAIGAKGLYDGTETVNSGFTGIIGFSFADPSGHFMSGAYYTIPSYSYFNRDFTPDGGATYPLRGDHWHSVQALSFYIRLGF